MTYDDVRILLEAYGKELGQHHSYADIEKTLKKIESLRRDMHKAWADRR